MIYINWSKNEKPTKSFINDKNYYLNKHNVDNDNLLKNKENDLFKNKKNDLLKNKNRENNNDRLNERDLISNNISNPFLIENNYIMDIKAQDKFLRPQRSN